VSARPCRAPTLANGGGIRVAALVSPALSIAALVSWGRSLDGVDVDAVTDLGLISVLPASAWIAYALLACGFCLALRERPVSQWLLTGHVLVLIIMLYALPSVLEAEPRLAAAWRHLGVIDYVTRTGTVDPSIDAYFNWPGFFVLASFVTELAGFKSATVFLDWAPVANAILYLAPLLVIFRAASADRRVVWLAIWLFYSTNWIGQDYFAPQAMSYFFYLVVLAIVLRSFTGKATAWKSDPEALRLISAWANVLPPSPARVEVPSEQSDSSPLQRGALLAIAIAVMLVTVATHQLTPFALVLGLTALALLRDLRAPNLPVLLTVGIGAWISFMAIAYVSGHLDVLTGGVGQIGDTVDANVGSRLHGTSDHVLIVRLRLVLTAVVWLFAVLGVRRCMRSGRPWQPMAALGLAPFALLALQPYGGEVLLRIYFFSLPFAAFFIASLFFAEPTSRLSTATTAVVAAFMIVLLGGTIAARYGNERMEHFTSSEVDAIHHLYDIAPTGSTLVTWGRNLPWKFQDYDKFTYREITDKDFWTGDESPRRALGRIEDLMAGATTGHVYLVFTRGQEAEDDILALSPPGRFERVERLVAESRRFQVVYQNGDATIFVFSERERT
jgi:hypothetical protein